jgi:cytoskeletal protein CcmA (bactofilin family)
MAGNVTVIGRTARVHGRVTGAGDIEVRGFVDGEISVGGDVTVDAEGLVGAGIQARRLVVRGAVRGNLVAEESIQLEDGARVVGDIRAPRVAIAPGALVRGFVETGARGTDSATHASRTASAGRSGTVSATPTIRTVASTPLSPPKPPAVKAAPPAPAPVHTPAPTSAPATAAAPAPINSLAHDGGPRRPPPPVVPALKKARGQIVKKKER